MGWCYKEILYNNILKWATNWKLSSVNRYTESRAMNVYLFNRLVRFTQSLPLTNTTIDEHWCVLNKHSIIANWFYPWLYINEINVGQTQTAWKPRCRHFGFQSSHVTSGTFNKELTLRESDQNAVYMTTYAVLQLIVFVKHKDSGCPIWSEYIQWNGVMWHSACF